jgi:hypothetical protein
MGSYEVTYVSFSFKNDKGEDVEKTKTFVVSADNEQDAEQVFKNENIKYKKINSVKKDNSNTIGNLYPQLMKLRDSLK